LRVLLIKTSSLGDVIHALPALTDAARAIPGIKFDWVVEEGFAEIPTWHPAVGKVIPVAIRRWRKNIWQTIKSGEWKRFKQSVRATRYDLVIDAQGLLKSAWLTRYVKAPVAGLDTFDYPVTHAEAQALWDYFLDYGLAAFGDYQDAMASDEPFLFHARISAALNIGLLDLRQLCSDVEAAYWSGSIALNAAEGFIRQLIGWREYVRGVYWLKMPDYASGNLFGNSRPLPEFYWTGDTQMNCMHQAIGQSLVHAYAHHIQRLMVTGNFALLVGVAPSQICDWYLAIYMDAFDWVELPNTLGMVMHADGGYLGSKPYCASGQYIKRMSDYCRDCAYKVSESTSEDACPFNSLYWHFLMRHRDLLRGNQRMAMVYRNLDRMSDAKQQALWQRGQDLLAKLDAGEAF
jgi:deoxyribodipyrimidine photolyase-related protein